MGHHDARSRGVFHAVEQGQCRVRFAPDGRLIEVSSGDLMIFPEGAAHDMVDSPPSLAIPLEEALCSQEKDSLRCTINGPASSHGSTTVLICGVFHFRDGGFHALRTMLPPILHVSGSRSDPTSWLQATLQRLSKEAASVTPGAHTIISRLTDILFVEGVREWLRTNESEGERLSKIVRDPLVSDALMRIHTEPGRPWTIASLAAEVSLSRSAFAAHFADVVGRPPLKYLTSWRMQLAKNWLQSSRSGLGEIAQRLGYASEDAFNRAFRREVGSAPGTYRKQVAGEPGSADF